MLNPIASLAGPVGPPPPPPAAASSAPKGAFAREFQQAQSETRPREATRPFRPAPEEEDEDHLQKRAYRQNVAPEAAAWAAPPAADPAGLPAPGGGGEMLTDDGKSTEPAGPGMEQAPLAGKTAPLGVPGEHRVPEAGGRPAPALQSHQDFSGVHPIATPSTHPASRPAGPAIATPVRPATAGDQGGAALEARATAPEADPPMAGSGWGESGATPPSAAPEESAAGPSKTGFSLSSEVALARGASGRGTRDKLAPAEAAQPIVPGETGSPARLATPRPEELIGGTRTKPEPEKWAAPDHRSLPPDPEMDGQKATPRADGLELPPTIDLPPTPKELPAPVGRMGRTETAGPGGPLDKQPGFRIEFRPETRLTGEGGTEVARHEFDETSLTVERESGEAEAALAAAPLAAPEHRGPAPALLPVTVPPGSGVPPTPAAGTAQEPETEGTPRLAAPGAPGAPGAKRETGASALARPARPAADVAGLPEGAARRREPSSPNPGGGLPPGEGTGPARASGRTPLKMEAPGAAGPLAEVPAEIEAAPLAERGSLRELRLEVRAPGAGEEGARAIRLELIEQNGRMEVALRTEDPDVAAELRESLPALVERLGTRDSAAEAGAGQGPGERGHSPDGQPGYSGEGGAGGGRQRGGREESPEGDDPASPGGAASRPSASEGWRKAFLRSFQAA